MTVYVMSNGWHAAIVVPRAQLPPGAIPEAADLPGAAYLSFGWGDAAYYPAPQPGFELLLSAAFAPTPAVLHLAGLGSPPPEAYPQEEVVALEIPARDFADLIAYLDATFERGEAGRAQPVAPGLARLSFFYPAKGAFHLFNTCNTWVARGLETAGLPVQVTGTVTAEDLMAKLRRLER